MSEMITFVCVCLSTIARDFYVDVSECWRRRCGFPRRKSRLILSECAWRSGHAVFSRSALSNNLFIRYSSAIVFGWVIVFVCLGVGVVSNRLMRPDGFIACFSSNGTPLALRHFRVFVSVATLIVYAFAPVRCRTGMLGHAIPCTYIFHVHYSDVPDHHRDDFFSIQCSGALRSVNHTNASQTKKLRRIESQSLRGWKRTGVCSIRNELCVLVESAVGCRLGDFASLWKCTIGGIYHNVTARGPGHGWLEEISI